MKSCPKCHAQVKDTARFCGRCGCDLSQYEASPAGGARFCEMCGAKLEPGEAYCPACGAKVEGQEGAELSETPLFPAGDGASFDLAQVEQAFDGQIARNAEYERTLTRARAFCVRGKYDEARAIYESLLEEDPGDMNGYMGLLRAVTENYTVYEGPAVDDSIRVAKEMSGQEDLSIFDADYAAYVARAEIYFAEKAEQERKAKEEAERKAKEEAERKAREIRENFTIENGVLEEYKGKGGAVVIPEGVTSIGDRAFKDCTSLISVTIPEGVTSIGDYAFSRCESLTSVTIPEGVTSIGGCAFWDCMSLTSVTIPEGVTSIGGGTFLCCKSLISVTISEGVTSIGDWAFAGCAGMTSVTIPNSVTSIGDYAFDSCTSLTSVTIPQYCSIGRDAFPCKVVRR